ncbi:MAG: S8 family serine peptidase [Rhodobacteraceae bacterium]|jgi:subtilisin family serine protease|nr:S8 family serine peptidase [Paracoccaceae bacterium]
MQPPIPERLTPQPTGGLIVTFKPGVDHAAQAQCLHDCIGPQARSFSTTSDDLADIDAATTAVLLDDSGVAIILDRDESPEIQARLLAADQIAEVRPEFWMFALDQFQDTGAATWGLQATGALTSPFTGQGIDLCVLDTGIDLQHPDFLTRAITQRSFVAAEDVMDGNGHGTHCAGTAAGPRPKGDTPRYGAAPNANLHVGKVLSNAGSGRERDIIAGMLWAINAGCEVISMSLGRAVAAGEGPSPDYARIGALALQRGSLIIAAAGNDSARRYGHIAPVGAPANSPAIMAVAAVDQALDVAEFSCGGVNPQGGEVDIAAPGVGIYSASPRPEMYRILRGTSMACPHVAGLAALLAESDPGLRGQALWDGLTRTVRKLPLPARDVGAGLALAPGGGAIA